MLKWVGCLGTSTAVGMGLGVTATMCSETIQEPLLCWIAESLGDIFRMYEFHEILDANVLVTRMLLCLLG